MKTAIFSTRRRLCDDLIQRLIVTGHQAFFTEDAIGQTMLATINGSVAIEQEQGLSTPLPRAP